MAFFGYGAIPEVVFDDDFIHVSTFLYLMASRANRSRCLTYWAKIAPSVFLAPRRLCLVLLQQERESNIYVSCAVLCCAVLCYAVLGTWSSIIHLSTSEALSLL